jgi:hypothetical protein
MGERYLIRFTNFSDDPGLVAQWESRPITQYHAGGFAGVSPVDLADLELVSPAPDLTSPLPVSFIWNRETDSQEFLYRFVLYDPADGSPLFQSPLLEQQQTYTLASLPEGFEYNTAYSWTVWIYGGDGSQLLSRQIRTISFAATQD